MYDVLTKDLAVTQKEVKVLSAWIVVVPLSDKWENMIDENRHKTATNFLIEMMGNGFWTTAGGLEGRIELELRSYYKNASLMDLYSDELIHLKGEIEKFYSSVDLYESAHESATKTINDHLETEHTSGSLQSHTIAPLETKKCRDNLPSFSCRGNHFAGNTACDKSYDTPSG